jgi:uncharacterized repeat protein (TIGR03803 family)
MFSTCCSLLSKLASCIAPFLLFSSLALCQAKFSVIHVFGSGTDAAEPAGQLVQDKSGNLYGTTFFGGSSSTGTVFELSPSTGRWNESILYSFANGSITGEDPEAGLVLDNAGNLFGTTWEGGPNSNGTVFELSSVAGNWTETTIAELPANYGAGLAGLLLRNDGVLYGASVGGGSIFKLTPPSAPGGTWDGQHFV